MPQQQNVWGRLFAVVRVAVIVAYPVLVYVGLTRFSARAVGVLLLVLVAPGLVRTIRVASRAELLSVLPAPLAVLFLSSAAAVLDDQRFFLALPVLINLVLLYTFGASLGKMPMIERFARLRERDLSEAKARYCRSVTIVWSVFFVLNAMASAALAILGSLSAWALYTGLLAYVLIGIVGTVEYTVRKYRFRDYGDQLHDRLFARVFPRPDPSPRAEQSEGCAS